jgi:signal transduction histidine kinase
VEATLAPAPFEGDSLLIERLVANLLNNALRHNIAGGRIEVVTEKTDTGALLTVSNTGPIILQPDVGRLFQPFQRLDPRRAHYQGGHGLGLSIVSAIARAHQAVISAEPLPDGGLVVSVTFPQPAGEFPSEIFTKDSQAY